MIDLHGVVSMDAAGLLHLWDLHRRAERLVLRVLAVGWQPHLHCPWHPRRSRCGP
ncbi:hypothetical protein ACIPWI_25170 [Streptomyces sp. NPDC090046]|uniref:hypothetical protein n=1 Tax=Streptomyces sp. NPDC090046 TaxID=3365928 RepID=UPI003819375F